MATESVASPSPTLNPSATTSAATLPVYIQPSTYIALNTTFKAPSSCFDNVLTQLPPPGWLLWFNEPIPFSGITSSQCFPSQFMSEYTSVSSSAWGSSIVPAMSPLVCPENYCTAFTTSSNYIACCPSGFSFRNPATTVDTKRPGYGGTCLRLLDQSSTYTLRGYDSEGVVLTTTYTARPEGDGQFAHPIDGFAVGSEPTLGCAAVSNATESTQRTTSAGGSGSGSSDSSSSSSLSGGAIAGIVIGAIAALALIIAVVWFLLRRRKTKQVGDEAVPVEGAVDEKARPYELHDSGRAELGGQYGGNHTELQGQDAKYTTAEFAGNGVVSELPGVPVAVEKDGDEKRVPSRAGSSHQDTGNGQR